MLLAFGAMEFVLDLTTLLDFFCILTPCGKSFKPDPTMLLETFPALIPDIGALTSNLETCGTVHHTQMQGPLHWPFILHTIRNRNHQYNQYNCSWSLMTLLFKPLFASDLGLSTVTTIEILG